MSLKDTAVKMMRFKRWANGITYGVVMVLPEGESLKVRKTRFKTIVSTLNHVYVIDDIFKAHLLGDTHGYTARNTQSHPPLADLFKMQQAMDDWFVSYAESLTEDGLNKIVEFEFVGGGEGEMSRADILMHIVNHGNYHRGFVGDMLYQAGVTPPATDYPVFLRDAY